MLSTRSKSDLPVGWIFLLSLETIELWTCDSVGFYRDHPAGVARFSEDGSILAVAFGATLTLWDPDVNVLKAVVSDPGHSEVIR